MKTIKWPLDLIAIIDITALELDNLINKKPNFKQFNLIIDDHNYVISNLFEIMHSISRHYHNVIVVPPNEFKIVDIINMCNTDFEIAASYYFYYHFKHLVDTAWILGYLSELLSLNLLQIYAEFYITTIRKAEITITGAYVGLFIKEYCIHLDFHLAVYLIPYRKIM